MKHNIQNQTLYRKDFKLLLQLMDLGFKKQKKQQQHTSGNWICYRCKFVPQVPCHSNKQAQTHNKQKINKKIV